MSGKCLDFQKGKCLEFQVKESCQCRRKMEAYFSENLQFSCSFFTETLPLTYFRRTTHSPRQFLGFPVLVNARY